MFIWSGDTFYSPVKKRYWAQWSVKSLMLNVFGFVGWLVDWLVFMAYQHLLVI